MVGAKPNYCLTLNDTLNIKDYNYDTSYDITTTCIYWASFKGKGEFHVLMKVLDIPIKTCAEGVYFGSS